MLILAILGCSADVCHTMCASVALKLEGCLEEWQADWEDFDVSSRLAFGDRCREEWDAERTTLEPRQFDAAIDECTQASEELDPMSCDELRALYLEP